MMIESEILSSVESSTSPNADSEPCNLATVPSNISNAVPISDIAAMRYACLISAKKNIIENNTPKHDNTFG